MNVATFRPASLQAQLAELKRERSMRVKVYPHLIASGKLDRNTADYQTRGLDAAIATIEAAVAAQLRGEPTRRELIETLRALVDHAKFMELGEAAPHGYFSAPVRNAIVLLERIPK